jgi:hypothetical protein
MRWVLTDERRIAVGEHGKAVERHETRITAAERRVRRGRSSAA